MASFLYFDGYKDQGRPEPRHSSGILFDAPGATYHQDNASSDDPFHGLWKFSADDRVVGSNLFITGKYAYFNTGFVLNPEGGLDVQAGRSFTTAQSFDRSCRASKHPPAARHQRRRQRVPDRDGRLSNDIKFPALAIAPPRRSPGRVLRATQDPGHRELARRICGPRCSARGSGSNKAYYTDFYVGDTIAKGRATIDLGLRYDQQSGKALPSNAAANPAFPNIVPALSFAGYDTPFTWKNFSPRAGLTYALDEARKTVAPRQLPCRYAGQLDTATIGAPEPELHGRGPHLSLGRPQRRSLRPGERSAAQSVHHGGGRLQPGGADGGHLAERARSEPAGAA